MRQENEVIENILSVAKQSAVELWHRTAVSVAGECGFAYPEETEKKMLDFIQGNRNAEF